MGKLDHYVGRKAVMVRTVKNRRGDIFPQGAIVRVTATTGRTITIRMLNPDPDNIFGAKYVKVRDIEPWRVRLLDEDPTPSR